MGYIYQSVKNKERNQRRKARRKREQVFELDNHQCVYCKIRLPDGEGEIDHKISIKMGGSNCLDNLQAICSDCNRLKGTLSDEDFRRAFRKVFG